MPVQTSCSSPGIRLSFEGTSSVAGAGTPTYITEEGAVGEYRDRCASQTKTIWVAFSSAEFDTKNSEF